MGVCAQPNTKTAKAPNEAQSAAKTLTISQLAETKYTYKIPDYQRGYRWGDCEVRALLDDINEIKEVQNHGNIANEDKY